MHQSGPRVDQAVPAVADDNDKADVFSDKASLEDNARIRGVEYD